MFSSVEKAVVIIPTFNESLNVEKLVDEVFRLYPGISILFVDDNSPDQTADIIRKLQLKYPQLHLLERPRKMGLGPAYIAGFQWALSRPYQFIVEMDADFSHTPKDLIRLIEAAEQADLVVGSRYLPGGQTKNWPLYRRAISLTGAFISRNLTGMDLSDVTSGFKCFRRETLLSLDFSRILSKGYVFQLEINFRVNELGLKIKEIPVTFQQRQMGTSKMNFQIILEGMTILLGLKLRKTFGRL